MRLIICLLFWLAGNQAWAQMGDFYLYNYPSPLNNTDHQNLSILQDPDGKMYFANTKGIIVYDGLEWDLIQTGSTPYVLHQGSEGVIYVGCRNHFGYIHKNEEGRLSYRTIARIGADETAVYQIVDFQELLYFYTEKVLYEVSPIDLQIKQTWSAPAGQAFNGLFSYQGSLYLNETFSGLQILKNKKIEAVSAPQNFTESNLLFACEFDSTRVLIGLEDNSLWLFDGQNFENYEIESQGYLQESLLTGGMSFSKKYLVLGTLSGGCIVIEKKTGLSREIINFQTGLPDDEILSLAKDTLGGLWICHEKGISRADLSLPILNFSNYPGIKGNITSLLKTDSTLYASTSEGLFYLAKVNQVEQLIKLIRQEKKEVQVVERNIQTTIQLQEAPYQEAYQTLLNEQEDQGETLSDRERKKLARKAKRMARRSKRYQDKNPDTVQPLVIPRLDTLKVENKVQFKPLDSVVFTRQVQEYRPSPNIDQDSLDLEVLPYIFNPVEGIKFKCRQLLPYQDRILVATHNGLYEVKNLSQAQLIVPNINITHLLNSQTYKDVVWITSNEGLIGLRLRNGAWQTFLAQKGMKEVIFSVAEQGNTLWLGGANHVFHLLLDPRGNILKEKTFQLPNDYTENTVVKMIKGEVRFILSSGIYQIDSDEENLRLDSDLQAYFNPLSKVIFSQTNYTWIKPKHQNWVNLDGNRESQKDPRAFLSFFDHIVDIHVDNLGNFWVVGNEKIYKIREDAFLSRQKIFRTFIRGVYTRQKALYKPLGELSTLENGLRFELSSDYFLKSEGWQFQYKLEGLEQEWSDWSSNTDINFPILPSGQYKLRVKARNIFGQEAKEAQLEFGIAQAYWEKTWFYALIIGLSLSFLYLLFYMRTRSLAYARKVLLQKVAEKTEEIQLKQNDLSQALEEISSQKAEIDEKNRALLSVNENLEQKVEERTAKLKSTLIELMQSNKELDTFIYRSSHDLRGPISRLIGLVNLIRLEPDRETILNHIHLIEFTAQKMDNMLDKLMNIHAINSEVLEYVETDIHELVADIQEKVKYITGWQDVYQIIKINTPSLLLTDPILLGLIIQNLLENSIQFKNPDRNVFSIAKLEISSDDDFIRVKLTDNGLGIADGVKDRIIDMFYRGNEASQGNGLGLYLVKKATEKLNGKIHFKSQEKNLTSFSVILPNPKVRVKSFPESELVN